MPESIIVQLDRATLEELFKTHTQQGELILAIIALAYPNGLWEQIEKLDGYVVCNQETSRWLMAKCMTWDSQHCPGVMHGVAYHEDLDEDHKGRKTITTNGWSQKIKLTPAECAALAKARKLQLEFGAHNQHVQELQARLANVGNQSEALKAQIYRKQIGDADGGAELLAMLDDNLKRTIEGGYTALL